ncbi:hypothetical protein OAL03_01655 [Akkermansiaceae bacterium]|nr:hypothetical protein [Akkermansiaceae bacterium]
MQSSVIRVRSYAKAMLAGNPSAGFYRKTLSFTFQDFFAEVTLFPFQHLELLAGRRHRPISSSVNDIVKLIDDFGYYGGIRLLQVTIKKFSEYCGSNKLILQSEIFSIRYFSTIAIRTRITSSGAVITASLKALMKFHNVGIVRQALANLVLSVKSDELGLGEGVLRWLSTNLKIGLKTAA